MEVSPPTTDHSAPSVPASTSEPAMQNTAIIFRRTACAPAAFSIRRNSSPSTTRELRELFRPRRLAAEHEQHLSPELVCCPLLVPGAQHAGSGRRRTGPASADENL